MIEHGILDIFSDFIPRFISEVQFNKSGRMDRVVEGDGDFTWMGVVRDSIFEDNLVLSTVDGQFSLSESDIDLYLSNLKCYVSESVLNAYFHLMNGLFVLRDELSGVVFKDEAFSVGLDRPGVIDVLDIYFDSLRVMESYIDYRTSVYASLVFDLVRDDIDFIFYDVHGDMSFSLGFNSWVVDYRAGVDGYIGVKCGGNGCLFTLKYDMAMYQKLSYLILGRYYTHFGGIL